MTKFVAALLGVVGVGLVVVACQPALTTLDDPSSAASPSGSAPTATRPASTSSTTAPATTTTGGTAPSTTTPAATSSTSTPPPPRPDSPGGDIEHHWYGAGPQVAILGDSLTVQARQHLRYLSAGSYALKVGALYGEGMSGGALSVNLPDPLMPAVVDEYAEDQPDVLVLALGTNDVWQPHIDPTSFEREWNAAIERFPTACLVGVTITQTDQALRYDPAEARRVNRVIRATADVVVDWTLEGPSHRYTDVDNIHLTDEGRLHFAELVLEGVRRCEARG